MKQEIGGYCFVVRFLIPDSLVVEKKREKDNNGAQERDLAQHNDLAEARFPENIAVLTQQAIQNNPESPDHNGRADQEKGYAFLNFGQNVFAQNVEHTPR